MLATRKKYKLVRFFEDRAKNKNFSSLSLVFDVVKNKIAEIQLKFQFVPAKIKMNVQNVWRWFFWMMMKKKQLNFKTLNFKQAIYY